MTQTPNGATPKPEFTDEVDYVLEFTQPPVLVDQVDYLLEFADPMPASLTPPMFVDRVDYVFEFNDPALQNVADTGPVESNPGVH